MVRGLMVSIVLGIGACAQARSITEITETGVTQTCENPDGHQASNADTKAF